MVPESTERHRLKRSSRLLHSLALLAMKLGLLLMKVLKSSQRLSPLTYSSFHVAVFPLSLNTARD
jgi:hypothetical protein